MTQATRKGQASPNQCGENSAHAQARRTIAHITHIALVRSEGFIYALLLGSSRASPHRSCSLPLAAAETTAQRQLPPPRQPPQRRRRCDLLRQPVRTSPVGSDYEAFGYSCGGRELAECSSILGAESPGTNPALDTFWDACGERSPSACDQLFLAADSQDAYYDYGLTCGNCEPVICSELLGDNGQPAILASWDPSDPVPGDDDGLDGVSSFPEHSGDDSGGDIVFDPDSPVPGTDAALDALWVACVTGNGQACDDLF